MSIKMIITKPTYDAKTETDPNNMIFSSDYGTLKYYASGSIDITVSGSDVEQTVAHNLGYVPFFIVYVEDVVTGVRFSQTPVAFEDAFNYGYIESYADANNIYFTIQTNSISANIQYYYKIFRNSTGL